MKGKFLFRSSHVLEGLGIHESHAFPLQEVKSLHIALLRAVLVTASFPPATPWMCEREESYL